MKYESARALKASLLRAPQVRNAAILAHRRQAGRRPAIALAAAPPANRPPPFALGIGGRKNSRHIAVRIHDTFAGLQDALDHIYVAAAGEVEILHVGRVRPQAHAEMGRRRPLTIGYSIGHYAITAGTLGCFVTTPGGSADDAYFLSNNHVLANENSASPGDAIVQPGPLDGGKRPQDVVGELTKFVPLATARPNLVDAAVAAVTSGLEYEYDHIAGRGALVGLRTTPLDVGESVYKLGRTTGPTEGVVRAIELDNLSVDYRIGTVTFEQQIEIERVGDNPFSKGGDSGSLIVDANNMAVALLFAGNDVRFTYANPIVPVLKTLGMDLLF